MTYDPKLADRVRQALSGRRDVIEKKMFGGLCFMVRGHMCCGVDAERLMLRVGPENYTEALRRSHAREMDFTGRPLKGFVFVELAGVRTAPLLKAWLAMALAYVTALPQRSATKRKTKGGKR